MFVGPVWWAIIGALLVGACAGQPRPAVGPGPEPLTGWLRKHVDHLAGTIGGRGLERPGTMEAAAAYLRGQWESQGYTVQVQTYAVNGQTVDNLGVEIPGRDPRLVIVGAHYDTCEGNPGADDNGSGIAAMLELSRRLHGSKPERTIRFVAFANEEPPHFKQPGAMGSHVYAKGLRDQGREVAAMLSLETIGYFSTAPNSQHYPQIIAPLYPDTGDFIGVVGANRGRELVRRIAKSLQEHGPVPVESIAAPASIPGIDWSDHWGFWEHGYHQAVMITDTAIYRNPHYHQPTDRPDTLDYDRLAWLVVALEGTVRDLAGIEAESPHSSKN